MTRELGPEEVARVFALRAQRMRFRPAMGDESVVWTAAFAHAGEVYALPLEGLRAVIPLRLVRSVPMSPPHVLGVLTFQGELVTALSFASLVGPRGRSTAATSLLVADVGSGRSCAIDCQGVPRPMTVTRRSFEAAAIRARAEGLGEIEAAERPVVLVDLRRLVAVAQRRDP